MRTVFYLLTLLISSPIYASSPFAPFVGDYQIIKNLTEEERLCGELVGTTFPGDQVIISSFARSASIEFYSKGEGSLIFLKDMKEASFEGEGRFLHSYFYGDDRLASWSSNTNSSSKLIRIEQIATNVFLLKISPTFRRAVPYCKKEIEFLLEKK